jgi:hypothetical protein
MHIVSPVGWMIIPYIRQVVSSVLCPVICMMCTVSPVVYTRRTVPPCRMPEMYCIVPPVSFMMCTVFPWVAGGVWHILYSRLNEVILYLRMLQYMRQTVSTPNYIRCTYISRVFH